MKKDFINLKKFNMKKLVLISFLILIFSCNVEKKMDNNIIKDPNLVYNEYSPNGDEIIISRADYIINLRVSGLHSALPIGLV